MKTHLFKILLFVFVFIGIERFCHKQTRGFSLLKIASHSPDCSQTQPLSEQQKEQMEDIFNQPFTFLNSGGQCYVFLSEDGKTVIKFFKNHHIRAWNFLRRLPLPSIFDSFIQDLLQKKIHQSPQFLQSCKIAYEDFKEHSGLIYLHVHKTNCFKKRLKIIDKLNIAHWIDLDNTDFALQKTVEMSYQKLKKLIAHQEIDTAKQCIDSLLELILQRCQKGIVDRDPNIRRNCGFLGTQAIEIDLGSFTKAEEMKDPACYSQELFEKTRKLRRWLSKEDSALTNYLLEKIKFYPSELKSI